MSTRRPTRRKRNTTPGGGFQRSRGCGDTARVTTLYSNRGNAVTSPVRRDEREAGRHPGLLGVVSCDVGTRMFFFALFGFRVWKVTTIRRTSTPTPHRPDQTMETKTCQRCKLELENNQVNFPHGASWCTKCCPVSDSDSD